MSDERRPPERLLDLGQGLAIWKVHVDDLAEQPLNAQVMRPDAFGRLKATIERDLRLESLPLAAYVKGEVEGSYRLEIVSGHHRVRAARQAGLFYIHVIVDETNLSRDFISAKQLAHNSIVGESEDQLVARIYRQINDVDARLEAFIPDSVGDTVPAAVKLPRMDLELGYRAITLVFLPRQADAFTKAVDQLIADKAIPEDVAELGLIDLELFEQWQAATRRIGKEYNARALTVVVSRLVAAAAEQLGLDGATAEELDPEAWVPLPEILGGSALLPPAEAKVVKAAVDAMVKSGEVQKKRGWQAIVAWAKRSTGAA